MTEAGQSFRAAEAAIAQALADRSDTLDLNAPEFRELAVLPPSISQLTGLRVIELDYTKVADISALRPLTGLRHLFLEWVPVRDLTPLSGMTGLTRLTLGNSHVEDIRPLRALSALELLTLNNTGVSDLTPLVGLDHLTTLRIEETPIDDLTPLLRLPGLWDGTGVHGLGFAGCAAARDTPELAAIACIEDHAARAAALRKYLEAAQGQD
ncbi:leucine-rich repeat domain-containing protein [Roseovarius faecimaris]|uniref:Leucine-rich repeat domain-containing protein n=1 Tax=Roseovarius faecimaris TaxID=2494550 RepID=A0A6I6IMU0_9RHOB|nr:hypothetical protein [Roseovarius faecimaris]QGX97131.1 leucine-rich repeat domain-containing protein [Roseovarius faecimaris]